MERYVVGISGASGFILSEKTIHLLIKLGYHVDLVITPSALHAAGYEMERGFASAKSFVKRFPEEEQKHITLHSNQDIGAPIASGTFRVKGMIIVPCSLSTVAAISIGLGDNCLRRAADVTLKEKRPLVVVPREMPLSCIHLENLLKLAKVGATIIPPLATWYNRPKSIDEMENFIVGRVLDALGIENSVYTRWKCQEEVLEIS